MDWEFLDIFKKAEFNTLMLSVAITGWILYICVPMNIYILGAAILSSAYCFIRLVVYTYQYLTTKWANKRYEAQKKHDNEVKEKEYEENRKIEITRMFEGLSNQNKFCLANIYLEGKRDPYNRNVFHFSKYGPDSVNLYTAQNNTMIYRTEYGGGQYCIYINEYTDSLSVTIDPFLYILIAEYAHEDK